MRSSYKTFVNKSLQLPIKLTVILAILFGLFQARAAFAAAADIKNAANGVIYLDGSKAEITVTKALMTAMQGQTAYKCTQVESGVSKSGSSIGLKTKKKKITKEEFESQVDQLKKRVEK